MVTQHNNNTVVFFVAKRYNVRLNECSKMQINIQHNRTNTKQPIKVLTQTKINKRKCIVNDIKKEATRGIAKVPIWSSSQAITCGV